MQLAVSLFYQNGCSHWCEILTVSIMRQLDKEKTFMFVTSDMESFKSKNNNFDLISQRC